MTTEKHLWAGWRSSYVANHNEARSPDECVFCRILASDADAAETFVVWRDDSMVALLNSFPYNSGHLLVMPTRHVGDIADLEPDERTQIWEVINSARQAVVTAYEPHGLNIGFNLGSAAGAGIPGHLHGHVLPRWQDDSNFMPAIAQTKVLPEALDVTWQKLSEAWPH